jgi:anti-sigma factor RsiW
MTCRDFRRMVDAFVSQHTTTATNPELLRHLGACPACRAELNERRRVRSALRAAFHDAADLEAAPDFAARLRDHVREQGESDRERGRAASRRSWMAVAACLVLAIGATGVVMRHQADPLANALAQDAIGDHRNCALKYRAVKMSVPLPEASTTVDSAYRVLISAPPNEIATPGGLVRVVDRHACAYDSRRFGHVIMQYRGHVVSLLLTAGGAGTAAGDSIPRPIGQPTSGLSVVSVTAADRSILLVGDVGSSELTKLSTIIATPLARRLTNGAQVAASPDIVAALQNGPPDGLWDRLLAVQR